MNRLIKKISFSILGLMVISGCNLVLPPEESTTWNTGPQAWIDAPLNDSILPLAPYTIVFHGADPGSVVQGELSINSAVEAALDNAEAGSSLAVFRWEWNPPAPGEYVLWARAQNTHGDWSEFAEVRVFVEEARQTDTPTPRSTETPTVTPTATEAGLVFMNNTQPTEVFRGSCSQNQIAFEVSVRPPETVAAMYVFIKLQDVALGTITSWDDGSALNPAGGGVYRRTIGTSTIPNGGDFNSAYVLYQFVATGADKLILGRSMVFADVVMNKCGIERFPIPLFPATRTPTPIIVK